MTHVRAPGSIEAALMDTLGDLSDSEVRAATGNGLKSFYKAASPAHDAGLRIEHAAALDAALVAKGQRPRLLPWARQMHAAKLAQLGGAAPHDPQHPLERFSSVAAELGDLAGELRAACHLTSPGGREITEREASAVLAAIEAAEAELAKLKADIHSAVVRRPRAVA